MYSNNKGKLYPHSEKTIREFEIGGMTQEELVNKLKHSGMRFNKFADTILRNTPFEVTEVPRKVETVEVALRDLGFNREVTSYEIMERAKNMNLHTCSVELAAYLRLNYLDQKEGRWTVIATEDLSNDPKQPRGLYLRKLKNQLCIRGYIAKFDYGWDPDDHFIFEKKNK